MISLDPHARYVTQQSAYARLLDNGPLTDRKIARYQREGRYGKREHRTKTTKQTLAQRYKL